MTTNATLLPPSVTREQAQMISALACAVRPHGARYWVPSSVVTALAQVRHVDLADLIILTVHAAADPENHGPAAIVRMVEELEA